MTISPVSRPGSSFDRVLAAVEQAGLRHKVTRGTHIQAECPTHPDTNPSLSIDYEPGEGRTLIHCQTNSCDAVEITAALDLSWPQTYDNYEDPETFAERRKREREEERRTGKRTAKPTSRPRSARPRPKLPKGRLPGRLTRVAPRPLSRWEIREVYDYTDLDALVIHQEVRHQRQVEAVDPGTGQSSVKVEKSFTQRWPDNKGGWLEKTPAGFTPVLYRLPDLGGWIEQGRTIWLLEGVKDTERFLGLGEAATTNPSGAGNFKPAQAESLAGAHLRVVVDHDLAGYRRGVRLASMLTVAADVGYYLPVPAGRHQDASDHLDAGHGLDDFVEVSVEVLQQLARVAEAEDAATLAADAATEAAARDDRVQGTTAKTAEADARFAARWAAETGKLLVRALTAYEDGRAAHATLARTTSVAAGAGSPVDLVDRLVQAVRECQDWVRAAHDSAGVDVPAELADYLVEIVVPSVDSDAEDGNWGEPDDEADVESNVVEHPTSSRLPGPSSLIQMSRGTWGFELGGPERRPRGVYQLVDGRWTFMAPLPHLHSRIVNRDGFGRRSGTYYLISAEPDSDKVLVGHDELVRHTWPNLLDLAVSHDDKILKAATTALEAAARLETEVVEGTPRVGANGMISVPVPETLPPGYLRTSDLGRAEALMGWGELLSQVALSPRMALVLGASAIGPFLHGLKGQSHLVSMHGDMNLGKSVTMEAAAAIWGNPGDEATGGVKMSWNLTGQGPTTFLGELGTLPAFFDEHGMAAPKSNSEWGELIFRITQGASRGRPAPNGRIGFHQGRQWHGVLVSSGNSRLMDGVGAGDKSGTQRRVVELAAPFTLSQTHSEAIEAIVGKVFGHLGLEILARHSLGTVRTHMQRAGELLGPFEHESATAQRMLEHMQAHVAGALILDEICGTDVLTGAALAGAQEYLADWSAPVHDADRIIDWLNDSLFREPARWPTVAQHIESISAAAPWSPDGEARSVIAVGGVDRNRLGVVANDGSWVAVVPTVWETMCTEELKVDSDGACRTLVERGVLMLQGSGDKHGNRTNQCNVKIGKTSKRMYKLSYAHLVPNEPEDTWEPPTPPAPTDTTPSTAPDTTAGTDDAAAASGCDPDSPADEVSDLSESSGVVTGETVTGNLVTVTGAVTGQVTGDTPPLTCEVTGVTGVTGEISHVGARTRINPQSTNETSTEADPSADEIICLDPDRKRPGCVVCGVTVGQLVNGVPVHLGPCLTKLTNTGDANADVDAGIQGHGLGLVPGQVPGAAPGVTCAVPGVPGTADTPDTETNLVDEPVSVHTTPPQRGRPEDGPRWRSPVAVLDEEQLHLPGGEVVAWPASYEDLGDLAVMAGRGQLRLGHGGGETLPDAGQIWVTSPATLERLGLPGELQLGTDISDLDAAASRKVILAAIATYSDLPAVAGARDKGWEIGVAGDLDVWTFCRHPDLLPNGVRIVVMPWIRDRMREVPLLAQATTVEELADNLAAAAHTLGVPYLIHPGLTAHKLIHHTRPPRLNPGGLSGTRADRVAVVRDTASELPGFYRNTSDQRFKTIESDYAWWRPMSSLMAAERDAEFVHVYDRKASYLTEWASWDLGVEDLEHRTGDDAVWDGKENAGLWLIERDWGTWPEPMLPEPTWEAVVEGASPGQTRVWVTTPTLVSMRKVGVTPTVTESYTWAIHVRYLDKAAERLKVARNHPNPAVAATAKQLYSVGSGRFGRNDGAFSHDPLWRPDWYDHIRAGARLKILLTLLGVKKRSDVLPLAVGRDSIVFASDERDPVKAWPGNPASLGDTPGLWAPEASGLLGPWGPVHLPEQRPGSPMRWRNVAALADLTNHKRGEQW